MSTKLLEELIEEEPFERRELKVASLKGRIMCMMLNGSINWENGCKFRDYIDKEEKQSLPST